MTFNYFTVLVQDIKINSTNIHNLFEDYSDPKKNVHIVSWQYLIDTRTLNVKKKLKKQQKNN